jgi:hypothetical protein
VGNFKIYSGPTAVACHHIAQHTQHWFIHLFQDLENSASSDALVREKIASLPPEVSEIGLLSKLEGNVCKAKLTMFITNLMCVTLCFCSRYS